MIDSVNIQAATPKRFEEIGFHPAVLEGLSEWCHAGGFRESRLLRSTYDALHHRHSEAENVGTSRDFGGTPFSVFELQIMSAPGVEGRYMSKDDGLVILGYQLADLTDTSSEGRIGLCRRWRYGEPVFASLAGDCQTYDESGKPQLTRAMRQQLLEILLGKRRDKQAAEELMSNKYLGRYDLGSDHPGSNENYTCIEHGESIYVFDSDEWHP